MGARSVFAHLMKPHEPHSFDQYGNITFDEIGWSDDHDPTVSKAFYGQVIYINARMLEVIDAILANYEWPAPIACTTSYVSPTSIGTGSAGRIAAGAGGR